MTDDRTPESDAPQDAEAPAPPEATETVEAEAVSAEATEPVAPETEAVAEFATTEADDTGEPAPDSAESDAAAPQAPAPQGAAVEDAAAEGEGEVPPERVSRRGKRSLSHGQAHIKASFNNTIISITDLSGNSIAWTSGGSVGFKGSRKSTPYAAQVAAEQAARKAGEVGIRKLDVVVRGSGSGRETAIRTLQVMGMEVTGVKDLTPTPHNGCRPKKRRGS